ncbi:hypothetical protein F1536_01165 [Achromobacter xylosoxidans]|nr:hypothetical protein F1536_01165 [Achromobacter xylosoxidans]
MSSIHWVRLFIAASRYSWCLKCSAFRPHAPPLRGSLPPEGAFLPWAGPAAKKEGGPHAVTAHQSTGENRAALGAAPYQHRYLQPICEADCANRSADCLHWEASCVLSLIVAH